MALEFAIDQLYATGWSALDSSGCRHHADGRSYPGPDRVRDELSGLGFGLRIEQVQQFSCYRAKWCDATGADVGAVTGATEAEAGVFALARVRREAAVAVV